MTDSFEDHADQSRVLATEPRWDVYWSPEGKKIATVTAKDAKTARRKAPMPYRKYLGEIYAVTKKP